MESPLKQMIENMEEKLSREYGELEQVNRRMLMPILENLGTVKETAPLSEEELKALGKNGGILAVDGSNNRFGGAKPHYVDFYQSVALCTGAPQEKIFRQDFRSPLFDDGETNPLAELEVEAALEGLQRFHPPVVFMDGSLIRFSIEANMLWKELHQECLEQNILLVGIIEDVKTKIVGEALKDTGALKRDYYDRELLFGMFSYGEALYLKENSIGKAREGLSSLFIRSSLAPQIIGLDLLSEQKEQREYAARLVLALTGKHSRGIPHLMDMVDVETRIGDKALEMILKESVRPEIFQRLLNPIRNEREF